MSEQEQEVVGKDPTELGTGMGGKLATLSKAEQELKARRAAKLARLSAKAGYLTDELARIEGVASKAAHLACYDMMAQMNPYVTESAMAKGCILRMVVPMIDAMCKPGRRAVRRLVTPKAIVDTSDVEKLFECLGNAADSLAAQVIEKVAHHKSVAWEGIELGLRRADYNWELFTYAFLVYDLHDGEEPAEGWSLREIKPPVKDGLLSDEDKVLSPPRTVAEALL